VAHPKKKWGQNFLRNRGAVGRIVEAIDARPDELILEIGPGEGVLTEKLIELPNELEAIEIDPDLARQLRRASASVALNCAEAMYARGRSRTACYNISLREMRESYAALEVSVRLQYLPPLAAELEDRIQRILGTLYRLSFPGRGER